MRRAGGIPTLTPYRPENLDEAGPDLVIIGNVIRRVNRFLFETRGQYDKVRLVTIGVPAEVDHTLATLTEPADDVVRADALRIFGLQWLPA
jgi:hypothetical protein